MGFAGSGLLLVLVVLVAASYVAEARSIRSNAAVDFQLTLHASTSSLLQMHDQMSFFMNAMSEASEGGSRSRQRANQRGGKKRVQPGGLVDTIWQAYFTARGGDGAFENLQTQVMEGVMTMRYKGMKLRGYDVSSRDLAMLAPAQGRIVTYRRAPNLLKIHSSFTQKLSLGQTVDTTYDQGFDGNVTWTQTLDEPALISKKAIASKKCAVNWNHLQMLNLPEMETGGCVWDSKSKYIGVENVNGEPAHVVWTEFNNMVYFFSKASDLLIKLKGNQNVTSENIGGLNFKHMNMEILMSDYRSVDGVLVPFHLEQTSTMSSVPGSPNDGPSSIISVVTTNITRVLSNVRVPQRHFQVPSNSEKKPALRQMNRNYKP